MVLKETELKSQGQSASLDTWLTAMLIERGVFTAAEFTSALGDEAVHLSESYEKRFPGFRAEDTGMVMDRRATETTKGWRP